MNPRQLLTGDPKRSSMLYLGIGAISLLKALAVRNDKRRFKRELLDAALFLGVGIALRKYGSLREQKQQELRESVPDVLLQALEGDGSGDDFASMAKKRFGRESEPEPEPSLRARATGFVRS
ncbi:hypothetical protein ACFQS4_14460 [Saliphagus sp. GCM10025317]